ncbi:hypothetical protein ACFCYH_15480 [Streptomyces sp. NPDC056400]|uniref:hypothetical protein n=1 Tax=Streptomyces sp. NPDC056400 TaxID=3345808 RepID=UPI0035E346CD
MQVTSLVCVMSGMFGMSMLVAGVASAKIVRRRETSCLPRTPPETLVQPRLVAEVSADRAIDHGGVYHHPLRFQRLRLDVRSAASASRIG